MGTYLHELFPLVDGNDVALKAQAAQHLVPGNLRVESISNGMWLGVLGQCFPFSEYLIAPEYTLNGNLTPDLAICRSGHFEIPNGDSTTEILNLRSPPILLFEGKAARDNLRYMTPMDYAQCLGQLRQNTRYPGQSSYLLWAVGRKCTFFHFQHPKVKNAFTPPSHGIYDNGLPVQFGDGQIRRIIKSDDTISQGASDYLRMMSPSNRVLKVVQKLHKDSSVDSIEEEKDPSVDETIEIEYENIEPDAIDDDLPLDPDALWDIIDDAEKIHELLENIRHEAQFQHAHGFWKFNKIKSPPTTN